MAVSELGTHTGAAQSAPTDLTTCLYLPAHTSHSVLHSSHHTPIQTTKGMPRKGENTQTNQTQTRASGFSGFQRVGKRQQQIRRGNSPGHPPRHCKPEHPPRRSEPEHPARRSKQEHPPSRSEPKHPPHRSEPEYPPRSSDGESNEDGEDYAEFSAGKVPYIFWEASLY